MCIPDSVQARRFILRPFTVPIATNAIKYTLRKDDYIFEAAADLNKQAPYLSVQKRYGRQVYKAHYAVKEEYAMVESGYSQTDADGDLPLIKVHSPDREGVQPWFSGVAANGGFRHQLY